MVKNIIKFFVLSVLFITGLLILAIISEEESLQTNKALNNNVDFKGYVIDFRTSNNHAFGVIRLQLTESSVATFNDTLKTGIYPYRINGDIAELYTTIPDGLDYYDTFKVHSNSHKFDFVSKTGHVKYTSDLFIIEDSYNIEFVKKETQFE
jgi:hypothetical protein